MNNNNNNNNNNNTSEVKELEKKLAQAQLLIQKAMEDQHQILQRINPQQ